MSKNEVPIEKSIIDFSEYSDSDQEDEMLKKEKQISDSIKELRKLLIERESVLYSFDEYESLQKQINTLKSEVHILQTTPIVDDIQKIIGDTYTFVFPDVLLELGVSYLHVNDTDTKDFLNQKNLISLKKEKESEVLSRMSIIPNVSNADVILKNFKKFMISIREETIKILVDKSKKILAKIDSELNQI